MAGAQRDGTEVKLVPGDERRSFKLGREGEQVTDLDVKAWHLDSAGNCLIIRLHLTETKPERVSEFRSAENKFTLRQKTPTLLEMTKFIIKTVTNCLIVIFH